MQIQSTHRRQPGQVFPNPIYKSSDMDLSGMFRILRPMMIGIIDTWKMMIDLFIRIEADFLPCLSQPVCKSIIIEITRELPIAGSYLHTMYHQIMAGLWGLIGFS